jgi:2-polyprenyl-3-methyl-5-hydroxy-6-metoxy-1,4-benzoquinol methylase
MASMPYTASEAKTVTSYGFSFAWASPYGHTLKIIERLGLKPGTVLDLGCGNGAVAEPLSERGFQYVGLDIDRKAVSELSTRGFEAHGLDLTPRVDLVERLLEIAGGRQIAAVLLLDVIEHMPDTREFLSVIREALDQLGRAVLIVSVPNVAHFDLGAKLMFGKWNYAQTGLLDRTHLQFFTSSRLRTEARACGLIEIDAHDFHLRVSDQHTPADHPALSFESPVAQALRMWRELADPHAETIQFVRAFAPCDVGEESSALSLGATGRSFLAVLMRTQGVRPSNLRDALTCLAAQTSDDFNVILTVHSEHPELVLDPVRELVNEFDPTFALRVDVVHVAGGRRARPLNVALDRVHAEYVAFLDDDDLVTANWVECFSDAAADGSIVRSVSAVRRVSVPPETHCAPYVVESPLEFRYSSDFDRVHHLWGNETPICSFAVPFDLIDTFGLRFDERLPVLEDWDFLMRCVALANVTDTREITSIYQMWTKGESSASQHDIGLWQATQRVLQDRANLLPQVLPAGSTAQLVRMCEQLAGIEIERSEAAAIRADAARQAREISRQVGEIERLASEIEEIHSKYLITINSLRWRVLGPPASAIASVRKWLRRS